MSRPATDPLTYWTRLFLFLGALLVVLAVLPAVVDFTLLRGELIVVAIVALKTLAPLGVLFLIVGAGLWLVRRLGR